MGFAEFDHNEWPYVKLSLRGSPTEADWVNYLTAYKRLYEKGEPFWLLIDTDNLGKVGFRYIFEQVQFMMENEENSKRWTRKVSVILRKPVARALVTALLAMRKPACPFQMFATKEEAEEWILADWIAVAS